jgi:hypothetical protein
MILLPTTATLDAIVARLWPSLHGWQDFCRFALAKHYSPKHSTAPSLICNS